MEECNNFKHFSKESVIDIILICIIGTIFHFAYEFSGRNILVALFSAVNESIWEHIKIACMSIYIVSFIKMAIKEKRDKNLWISLFFKIISIIIIIPIFFYSYRSILGIEVLYLDLIILYISIIISEIVENYVKRCLVISSKVEDIYKYVNIIVILIFVIFTFWTPNLGIFRDFTVEKYRI